MADTRRHGMFSLFVLSAVLMSITPPLPCKGQWTSFGGNIENQRYNKDELKISVTTAPNLKLKWNFTAPGAPADISATPALHNGVLYFPSWNGNIYALNASTGKTIWAKSVATLLAPIGPRPGDDLLRSRATTVVAPTEGLLLVSVWGPGYVLALSLKTGNLVWKSLLDSFPYTKITASGTVYVGAYYIGVSSDEETADGLTKFTVPGVPDYKCCKFRGSLVKLNLTNGQIVWKTYMAPDNGGRTDQYSGNAIWGSGPAIDTARKLVIVGTGNPYNVPKRIQDCQTAQNRIRMPGDPCLEAGNWGNSLVAVALDTGRVVWGKQLDGYDVWNNGCGRVNRYVREFNTSGFKDPTAVGDLTKPLNPNCPMGPNVDYDFGHCPALLTDTLGRALAVAGQKSGMVWALDRNTGKIVWATPAGPSGAPGGLRQSGGGIQWGISTDGTRIYVSVLNGNSLNFTLLPGKNVTTNGGWVALNATSGKILWSVANPRQEVLPYRAGAAGPPAVVNGVVFVTSMDRQGYVYALQASTGKILFQYKTGSGVFGGFSIGGGCAYIGTGTGNRRTSRSGRIEPGNKLFAFCV